MLGISIRLTVFAAAMAVLLVVIVQAMVRPIDGEMHSYTAVFTDANGLKVGDDVRMYGVQVGNVSSFELEGSEAVVRFTVKSDRPVYDTSTFAIRYQTLVGTRYMDVRQPTTPGAQLASGARIGTDHTIPSFDITTVFNGLQPVLSELSPASLNRFAENLLAVIEGDGTGIGPALDSIAELSSFVSDRQQVIATLVSNLRAVADQLGGRSGSTVALLDGLTNAFSSLEQQMDSVVDFALTAPSVLAPFDSLAATLGLTPEDNSDLDKLVAAVIPDPAAARDVLRQLPGLLQSLNALLPAAGPDVDTKCVSGNADVPGALHVLFGGQRIVICKR